MDVVVVESPTKAKTIGKYVGGRYTVVASNGHVRDLPEKDGSVLPDDGFAMRWQIMARSQKNLTAIVRAVKGAKTLYLATDPDREGEAIAYHIVEALTQRKRSLRERFHRITFNEITKSAVLEALKEPGEIDLPRIEAQQARRILDRLVGYRVSPLLWKKIKPGLSAGRVQSVAVRLLVERERERRAFRSGAWWRLRAHLAADGGAFTADLAALDGKPAA